MPQVEEMTEAEKDEYNAYLDGLAETAYVEMEWPEDYSF